MLDEDRKIKAQSVISAIVSCRGPCALALHCRWPRVLVLQLRQVGCVFAFTAFHLPRQVGCMWGMGCVSITPLQTLPCGSVPWLGSVSTACGDRLCLSVIPSPRRPRSTQQSPTHYRDIQARSRALQHRQLTKQTAWGHTAHQQWGQPRQTTRKQHWIYNGESSPQHAKKPSRTHTHTHSTAS